MNFEKEIQEAVENIRNNYNEIVDDWCKAYMAQRYKEGRSIDPGSFTLCQQNLYSDKIAYKYWFEDKNPDTKESIIRCLDQAVEHIKYLSDTLDYPQNENKLIKIAHAMNLIEMAITMLDDV